MKYLIFAGGSGTRFWPLSRKQEPKQFLKIFDGKSTFELAVERAFEHCKSDEIRICTHQRYEQTVLEQGKEYGLKKQHLFLEPAKRNIGPAIGLAMMWLKSEGYDGNLTMMWADHLISDTKTFFDTLKINDEVINSGKSDAVLIGIKPTYANFNLGWIKIGEKMSKTYELLDFIYRPEPIKCEKLFATGKWLWNSGYYSISMSALDDILKKYNRDLYDKVSQVADLIISHGPGDKIQQLYESIEPITSDDAVVYKLDKSRASVVQADFDWEDPGTLYAYKRYYKPSDENLVKGEAKLYKSDDCLVYNDTDDKIVGLGLDGVVIVRMKDVFYVMHKDSAIDAGKMLDEMARSKYKDIV